ncbi:MAG: peptidoglycan editing factor PgeF [Variovorax sp.]|nr:MAG: peptidoglycan editing factor PgeF [Variovorax sp.]
MPKPEAAGLHDWLVPDWPAPPNVRALCTTRSGGVSQGRYASLNLGDHVADEAQDVAANRKRLQHAIGVRPVFLQQVHGTAVAELDAQTPDGTAADACISAEVGVACTVMVADCLPVLFTDETGSRVAAAHAGWRGLAAGVLEQTVAGMRARGSQAHTMDGVRVLAWLGPCIGPRAFQVGTEVREAFVASHPGAAACFAPGPADGKWLADLPALARQRLHAAGIDAIYGNDSTDGWCTVNNPLRFFSHRRDGVSGRFASLIWRV